MRRAVLLVTPIVPAATGNGLAMRAGLTLDALARRFDVHLAVIPVSDPHPAVTPFVADRAARTLIVEPGMAVDAHAALIGRVIDPAERLRQRLRYPRPWLSRLASPRAIAAVSAWGKEATFGFVHVMRLHLAPFVMAASAQRPAPVCVLDLDDDEMRTRTELAALHERRGAMAEAAVERAEATAYAVFAADWFPGFDGVLTAAAPDAERLRADYPETRFETLPNGYPEIAPLTTLGAAEGLRVLFVGNFGYAPNADAALFLGREVLPHLRDATGGRIRIDLIGGGVPAEVARLGEDPALVLHGAVADLAPCYAGADVAAVCVRAGGGTRVKILEAFAHRVPVVATTTGAAGLDLRGGTDFLRADTAEAFAAACVRVWRDPDLADRLREAGAGLLRDRYGASTVAERLARIYDALAERSKSHGGQRNDRARDGRRAGDQYGR